MHQLGQLSGLELQSSYRCSGLDVRSSGLSSGFQSDVVRFGAGSEARRQCERCSVYHRRVVVSAQVQSLEALP